MLQPRSLAAVSECRRGFNALTAVCAAQPLPPLPSPVLVPEWPSSGSSAAVASVGVAAACLTCHDARRTVSAGPRGRGRAGGRFALRRAQLQQLGAV